MYDFFRICQKEVEKRGTIESVIIFPKFVVKNHSDDLMVRGGDFYAVWDERSGLWSVNEDTVSEIIDEAIHKYVDDLKEKKRYGDHVKFVPQYMWDSDSGSIDKWHKFVQKQLRDHYKQLDGKIIFQNTEVTKEDYASKRLPYAIAEGEMPAYEEMISTLYSEEERRKLEWAIGSIIAGDSKHIQKFIVLYGDKGTGKSTVLHIIEKMFDGYWASFSSKSLASANNDFALEDFKNNPLVAIEHEGDLSKIADNTKLNSIVSHEHMVINEKFKSKYSAKFDSFMFIGTNKPVYITEAKSGLLRRLIDVRPIGNKIPYSRYLKLNRQIKYELGSIAYHCLKVYEKLGEDYYNSYIPKEMMSVTNDFYDFVEERFDDFFTSDEISLTAAWDLYKAYCDSANVLYPMPRKIFKEELKNYFNDWKDRGRDKDGNLVRNLYSGFKYEMFIQRQEETKEPADDKSKDWLELTEQPSSIFDMLCHDCPAQYATKDEKPKKQWAKVDTVLGDLDTSKLHYVKVPENHIVIDFDLKENGEKSFDKNLAAANLWPETYAEVSKSGKGIHLHYIYDGDVEQLSRIYDEDIEVKVFTGLSSLRRKLSKCNSIPIAKINSGLPLKGAKVVNFETIKNERQIRRRIERCLNKEHHGATAPEVDFIFATLEDAYKSGISYDVSDLRQKVMVFANNSTNQSAKCIKKVRQMHFQSEDQIVRPTNRKYISETPVFFDVEVFPNLFGVVYKMAGDNKPVQLINPMPADIAHLCQFKLIGFNNRRYDNHILYARMQGFSELELYKLSQRLINKKDPNAMFREAYNLSYTDIYDFCSKKQSLKKWEIELASEEDSLYSKAQKLKDAGWSLADISQEIGKPVEIIEGHLNGTLKSGIHHQELGLPWDQPVPEELWPTVMEYCVNDVIATEAVFNARHDDFIAREILADITGLTVNDTTNQCTTKLIVGDDQNPQDKFIYTDLSKTFKGYIYEAGVSTYRGEVVGEGGYVYSEPGMYQNVALLDIASMHPHSALALNIFGVYTKNFEELVRARMFIKHGEYEEAGKLFDGKLKPYLKDTKQAKALSYALKIAINSVYGLTAAKFDNKLRDPRNIDNIVAKRGALFMVDLKHAVQEMGYTVAHIKTDSIKIPNADKKIIDFVTEFGKKYGYTFEHEATYDRMCLVNDAVYIAKYNDGDHEFELSTGEKIMTPWTATGAQFQVPYVFKSLFSKSELSFRDFCETKTVTTALYLDMNESLGEDEHDYQFVGKAGQFCPIVEGKGGGILLREKEGKYSAATGTKGYRWLESERVSLLGKEKDIDMSYYKRLVDDAIASISEFGDYEWFVS